MTGSAPTLPVPVPGRWVLDARCGRTGLDWWSRTRRGHEADAKAVCSTCPVKAPCLRLGHEVDADLGSHLAFGIYGGMTVDERRAERERPPWISATGRERLAARTPTSRAELRSNAGLDDAIDDGDDR